MCSASNYNIEEAIKEIMLNVGGDRKVTNARCKNK